VTTNHGITPTAADEDALPPSRRALRRPFRALIPLVVVAGLLSAGAAALVTAFQDSVFESSVTLVLQTDASANDTEMLVRTITSLIPTEVIGLGLQSQSNVDRAPSDIVDRLEVSRAPGTAMLTVTYTDQDEQVSKRVAEHLVAEITQRIQDLNESTPGQLEMNYSVAPWGGGAVTVKEVQPPVAKNALAGLLGGAILGAAIAVLHNMRRPVVHDAADQDEVFDVILPRSLLGNPNILHRVGRLIKSRAFGVPNPVIFLTGPVSDSVRERFAEQIAAHVRHGRRPATVARLRDFSAESEEAVAERKAPVLVVGPRSPGTTAWVETSLRADVVVLLAQTDRSTIVDLAATRILVGGAEVIEILIDGSHLRVVQSGTRAKV